MGKGMVYLTFKNFICVECGGNLNIYVSLKVWFLLASIILHFVITETPTLFCGLKNLTHPSLTKCEVYKEGIFTFG